MLTPLDEQLGIDHANFAAHAKSLIATGCGGELTLEDAPGGGLEVVVRLPAC